MLAAATYAALGLLIGVLVRGDLEGFFLIIMIAMLDTFLENPVDNPLANKPILEFFPSYGPTQFAAAGAFHHQVLAGMAAVSLAWTAAFALLGLAVLRLRMPRPAHAAAPPAATSPAGTPSTATPSTGTPSTSPHHQAQTAAVAQTSGGPGRNPGESGLTADQRVVPPPAARAG
jgi:ABC-2 type transport system permease protein